MVDLKDTFLSEKQYRVLKARSSGKTQREIAGEIGVSREAVTILERRSRKNVEMARKTIEAFELLDPIVVKVPKGTDLFEVPRIVLGTGDRHSIDVLYNATSIIGMVRRKAGGRVRGNRVVEGFDILLLRSGRLAFE